MRTKFLPFILIALFCSFAVVNVNSQTIDMVGPAGSGAYGASITVLKNGNYVVRDPTYSEGGISNIGAVYLYSGSTNTLVSTLKGSTANDQVGGLIVPLNNGNFVVCSSFWNNGPALRAGAVTWCSGTTGLNGVVSTANSLVGSSTDDHIGPSFGLSNGNYVVASPGWSNGAAAAAGAATWCNGTTGLTGPITSTNSLVGTSTNDYVGNVSILANGNYVVSSSWSNGGTTMRAGSATWCDGTTGFAGTVNSSNSLTGTFTGQAVGTEILPLANGNYLIRSSNSVTWANGGMAITGTVNSTNSFIGTAPDNLINNAVILPNSNYLIIGKISGEVSVTWANGSTGDIFPRTTSNSFLSGLNVNPLKNGTYVLSNPYWNGNRGATILCASNGTTTGTFNNSNSLVGSNVNDYIGSAGITLLTNNNFVVCSPNWNGKLGAVTLCQSDGSTTGPVTSSNSLVGSNANDSIGSGVGPLSGGGATALTNGNYVINSPKWNNNKGAITWANGFTGVTGQVNVNNSLVGSTSGDRLGIGGYYLEVIPNFRDTTYYYPGVFALGNGNYVMASVGWNGNTGLVAWGDGQKGTSGIASSQNSLIGVTNIYNPGNIPLLASVIPTFTFSTLLFDATFLTYTDYNSSTSYSLNGGLENIYLKNLSNNYVIQGIDAMSNKATITWGNGYGGTKGSTNTCNTVYGSIANGVNNMNYVFDSVYNYLLVGRPADNIVSRYYPALGATAPSGTDNSSSTISGNSTFVFPSTTGCGQIAALTPSGANPVSGSVTAKTWLESPQPVNFVARHYEITPAINPGTATGTVTLYFTQADFNNFNNQTPSPALQLPTGPSDAGGIANLLVQKEAGISTTGTGLPGTYPGPVITIDPADNNIVWNSSLQRWEVSFDVTGFSGFFIKTTALTALPLRLLSFSGRRQGSSNQLEWKTANEIGTKTFIVQSSTDGINFLDIGSVAANGGGVYSFTDTNPIAKRTYYRLKMLDADGKFTYSTIIVINGFDNSSIGLYPNPVLTNTTLDIGSNSGLIGTTAQLTDASGRLLTIYFISHPQQLLDMAAYPTGLYFLKLKGKTIKVLKQ